MDDFLKSVRTVLLDRITSPLSGSLVISWLLWNWRVIVLILFSGEDETSIEILHNVDASYDHYRWIVLPIVSSLFFIFIYPHISKFMYRYSLKQKLSLKQARDEIELNTMLTVEESRIIVVAAAEEREQLKEQIRKISTESNNYRSKLEEIQEEVKTKYDEEKRLRDEIEERRLKEDELSTEILRLKTELIDRNKLFDAMKSRDGKMQSEDQTEYDLAVMTDYRSLTKKYGSKALHDRLNTLAENGRIDLDDEDKPTVNIANSLKMLGYVKFSDNGLLIKERKAFFTKSGWDLFEYAERTNSMHS